MADFNHIHQVLVDSGYPESHDSEWFIKIYEYNGNRMTPHWYDCRTKERAKVAVKSLLNKTDIYEVTVFNPVTKATSFHGKFTTHSEHEWNYLFH